MPHCNLPPVRRHRTTRPLHSHESHSDLALPLSASVPGIREHAQLSANARWRTAPCRCGGCGRYGWRSSRCGASGHHPPNKTIAPVPPEPNPSSTPHICGVWIDWACGARGRGADVGRREGSDAVDSKHLQEHAEAIAARANTTSRQDFDKKKRKRERERERARESGRDRKKERAREKWAGG
eukprot:15370-Rhodomonas_salina.4